jgi:hypothetical protein
MELFELDQDRDRWWALVNVVTKIRVLIYARNFLAIAGVCQVLTKYSTFFLRTAP